MHAQQLVRGPEPCLNKTPQFIMSEKHSSMIVTESLQVASQKKTGSRGGNRLPSGATSQDCARVRYADIASKLNTLSQGLEIGTQLEIAPEIPRGRVAAS
jgi:hypothetical protein